MLRRVPSLLQVIRALCPTLWKDPPKVVSSRCRSFRPHLEILEDRITPTNSSWAFIGGAPGAPASWDNPAAWVPLTPPAPGQVLPDATDEVFIGNPAVGTPAFAAIPSTSTENVANVTVTGGSSLTVNGTLDVAPNGNAAGFTGTTMVAGTGLLSVPTAGTVNTTILSSAAGGTVGTDGIVDSGTININSGPGVLAGPTDVFGQMNATSGGIAGGTEVLTGPGTIESGGSVNSSGVADVIFASPAATPWDIAPGGALDQLSIGEINISGSVSVGGTVNDLGQLDITPASAIPGTSIVTPGASLGGPGTFQTSGPANFSGGTLNLGGGFDVNATSNFQTSGGSTKTIATVFDNWSTITQFGGTGPIDVGNALLGTPGTLDNLPGSVLRLSTSVAVAPGTSSFVNGGELYASGGTVSVSGLTSNTGESQIDVDAGTTLVLAGGDTLGGSLYNDTGATVIVPAGAVDTINSPFTEDHSGDPAGSFTIDGSVGITSSGSATFNGPLTVSGSGATLAAAGPLTVYDLTVSGGGTVGAGAGLTNDGTTTITTAGTVNTTIDPLVNDGTLTEDGTLNVFAGLTNNDSVLVGGTAGVAGTLQNNGSVEVQAGGVLTATGELDNASGNSTLNVDAPAGVFPAGSLIVTLTGSLVNDGGTVTVAGTAGTSGTVTNSGTVEVTAGGQLRGSSNVDNSGVLQLDGGSTFGESGTLNNTGTVVLGAGNTATVGALVQNGDLQVNIASAMDYGTLGVTGLLTLTAAPDALTLTLVDDYQPPSGSTFNIVTFGSLQGQFADVEPPDWSVSYNTDDITATAP